MTTSTPDSRMTAVIASPAGPPGADTPILGGSTSVRDDSATPPSQTRRRVDQAILFAFIAIPFLAILAAIPVAAQAAYHDIQWEALSTTLSEASRVPEPVLVPALQAECQTADNSVFNQPPPPSSPTST